MKKSLLILILIAVLFTVKCEPSTLGIDDDKWAHLFAGAFVSECLKSRYDVGFIERTAWVFGLAMVKEMYDHRYRGTGFNHEDIFWTMGGSILSFEVKF